MLSGEVSNERGGRAPFPETVDEGVLLSRERAGPSTVTSGLSGAQESQAAE